MYTRLAKVLLNILTVLGVITALIAPAAYGEASGDYGGAVILFLVGLLVMTVLLLSLGVFVELANNVMDINIYIQQLSNLPYTPSSGMGTVMTETTSQSTWLCKRCGAVNPEKVEICKGCGNQKHQSKKASLETMAEEMEKERMEKKVTKEFTGEKETQNIPKPEPKPEPREWFCSSCGEKNRAEAIFCASCGKKKRS